MSQFYRLMDYYDDISIDIITSGYNYLLQALGILIFMLGLNKKAKYFSKKALFIILLVSGSFFMAISQLSNNPVIITVSGYLLNIHIGLYSAFYLTLLAKHYPYKTIGFAFGLAYALGSLGTYFLSLVNDGMFLVSKTITAVYFIMISIAISLIIYSDNIDYDKSISFNDLKDQQIGYLIPIVIIMTIINVFGSDLYYSLPVAKDVNWNLIRAFYSIGLIIAGILVDNNRFIGEVTAVSSLAYPLITTALVGEGMNNTYVLALSYFFRGFLTIYYIVSFIFLSEKDDKYLILAPCGLMVSRITEAIISLLLLLSDIPAIIKLVFSSICFIPLLILLSLMQRNRYSIPVSQEKRLANFADKYDLTSREIELISCLCQGMSDLEIAQKLFISKNTVRFHISNILKKTKTSSRIDVINMFNKM